jgi:nucleotide-binding universal stress UspA family protein
MIGSLLVPVDASSYAQSAQEHALVLAKVFQARVTGLYVLDARFLEMPPYLDYSQTFEARPPSILPLEVLEQYRLKSERILAGLQESAEKLSISAELRTEEGDPSQIIADMGKSYDLIVMGKRGEHAKWGKDLLGSTAENVVRRSATPVLLAESKARAVRRMTVLFDGSAPALRALKLAADIAGHVDATLRVFTAGDDAESAERIQIEAKLYLDPLSVKVGYAVRVGKAVPTAIDDLEHHPADLVVAGMQGHSAVHHLILGSTTEHVMRSIARPILLAP